MSKHKRTYSQLEKQFSEKNSSYIALQERVKDLEDENNNLKYKLAETNAEIIRKEQEIRKQTNMKEYGSENYFSSEFGKKAIKDYWKNIITNVHPF